MRLSITGKAAEREGVRKAGGRRFSLAELGGKGGEEGRGREKSQMC